jgi:hypothetical protein
MESECVDPRAARIAEAEELGDFVVGFAGGIVEGAADQGVVPGVLGGVGEIEVGVAAGDDEGECGVVGEGLVWVWLCRFPCLRFEAWGAPRL